MCFLHVSDIGFFNGYQMLSLVWARVFSEAHEAVGGRGGHGGMVAWSSVSFCTLQVALFSCPSGNCETWPLQVVQKFTVQRPQGSHDLSHWLGLRRGPLKSRNLAGNPTNRCLSGASQVPLSFGPFTLPPATCHLVLRWDRLLFPCNKCHLVMWSTEYLVGAYGVG